MLLLDTFHKLLVRYYILLDSLNSIYLRDIVKLCFLTDFLHYEYSIKHLTENTVWGTIIHGSVYLKGGLFIFS